MFTTSLPRVTGLCGTKWTLILVPRSNTHSHPIIRYITQLDQSVHIISPVVLDDQHINIKYSTFQDGDLRLILLVEFPSDEHPPYLLGASSNRVQA